MMATTIYDVTIFQFIIGIFNAIVSVAYLILGWYIMRNKNYLKWKPHIYPVTMYGCYIFGVSLMGYAGTDYYTSLKFSGILIHFFMFLGASAIGYAVWQDVERLIYKFDKMQEQEKEITHLKGIIEQLKNIIEQLKKAPVKLLILISSLLIFSGCGSMKKEVERLKTEQTTYKTESGKTISDLKAKISEYEQTEKTQSEKIKTQQQQIEKNSTEISQLTEKLNQQNKDDISIKGATGNVKVTDSQGNTYDIPSGAATEINRKSESSIIRELSAFKEKAENFRMTAINAMKEVFTKDNIIKQRDLEIDQKNKEIFDVTEKNKELASRVSKEKTREATAWWLWVGVGAGSMLLLIVIGWVVWKSYAAGNPIFKIFKK